MVRGLNRQLRPRGRKITDLLQMLVDCPFGARSLPSLKSKSSTVSIDPIKTRIHHHRTPICSYTTNRQLEVKLNASINESHHSTTPSIHDAHTMLNAEQITIDLGYTWLTHWKLVEEDRQFRNQVVDAIRGRQAQRHQHILTSLSLDSPSLDEAAPNNSAEAESGYQQPFHSSNSSIHTDTNDTIAVGSTDVLGEKSSTLAEENEFRVINNRICINSSLSSPLDDLEWLASHPIDDQHLIGIRQPATQSPTIYWQENRMDSNKNADSLVSNDIKLVVGGETATVRPLWISVYTEESTGWSRLFETVVPLQDEIVEKVSADLTPFCSVSGLKFRDFADINHGAWVSYFVGLIGDVAVEENDILWPNQVLHRDRVLYNVRDAGDVARFLADPQKEDVELHLENLRRLAEERKYKAGWCWYMLRMRWGEMSLKTLGFTQDTI